MLSKSIAKLVQYGVETGLVPECEKNYTVNLLLMFLKKMSIQIRKRHFMLLIWRKRWMNCSMRQ